MELRWQDFDGADAAADGDYQAHWADLEAVLRSLPVHFKASDQAGIQGSVIFDPVGTNDFIKTRSSLEREEPVLPCAVDRLELLLTEGAGRAVPRSRRPERWLRHVVHVRSKPPTQP
jgi:hypothetical protein